MYEATITIERGDEELEVTVEGIWERADWSVGLAGGVELQGATGPDGAAVVLTDAEEHRAREALFNLADADEYEPDYEPEDEDEDDYECD